MFVLCWLGHHVPAKLPPHVPNHDSFVLSCTVPLIHLSLFLALLGVLDEFLVEQGVDGFTLFSDVMV